MLPNKKWYSNDTMVSSPSIEQRASSITNIVLAKYRYSYLYPLSSSVITTRRNVLTADRRHPLRVWPVAVSPAPSGGRAASPCGPRTSTPETVERLYSTQTVSCNRHFVSAYFLNHNIESTQNERPQGNRALSLLLLTGLELRLMKPLKNGYMKPSLFPITTCDYIRPTRTLQSIPKGSHP